MSIKDLIVKHQRLCHAMQTGVSYDLETDTGRPSGMPKHLRVAVNVALCDHAGLVRLLISKGIITDLEYYQAIVDEMEREVERYVQRLKEYYSTDVDITLL